MRTGRVLAALALGCGLVLSGCGGHGEDKASDKLLGAPGTAGEWSRPGRDMGDSYYSPLEGIDADNAGKLGLAFEFTDFKIRGGMHYALQSTPVVQDGTLYFSGPWGEAYAVDAKTGATRWSFDTKADGSYGRNACCSVSNRGIALADGKVFVGSLDGYLFAIDAKTGKQVWKSDTFVDRHWNYASNGYPQIAGNVVIIGNGGGDMGSRGYVSAFDLKTGKLAWRFWVVPGDPAKGPDENPDVTAARKTWPADARWDMGLGGNAWAGLAYDPETDTAFIGTGNGGPHPSWLRSKSGKIGDELYLSSIVAVNAKTGQVKWHYQEVPGDNWDYAATAPLVLANLEIDGKPRKVIMQAPKNGVFYVLDRDTGKLLRANPYTRVNWMTGIDMATGRPKLNPEADYRNGPKLVWPSGAGGHGWAPMAFSPRTGLVYIPTYDAGMKLSQITPAKFVPGHINQYAEGSFPPFAKEDLAGRPQSKFEGRLTAWDPVSNKARWSVTLPTFLGGGTMVAGDLVFQGSATGYLDAYDAATGKQVAHIFIGTVITAAPMTYELDGQQYIAILAGAGGPQGGAFAPGVAGLAYENYQRLVVLKVGGGAIPLPPKRKPVVLPPIPKPIAAGAAVLARGQRLFMDNCSRCHAAGGSVGVYPNLWTLQQPVIDSFDQIVHDGALSYAGMAAFKDSLSQADIDAIKAFIVTDTINRRKGIVKGATGIQRQTH
ncbi:MAG: PQQ-dependent dehydrogenase, methanol/ethanol family [Candidatus Andeanibacterium colombiense]|uniref:PQQ-dependent dehydrogenase, methanol/ethanol family n=1 Tax=Candidatus Andeanibacterium colombiense TaxID=3121345 RepID=A0AAJ5X6E5_9SPHN|nr:MAG: PQQ-dependent dehydrogenase, methanol/ethanol family [Sphingomonadaceae bacterium]